MIEALLEKPCWVIDFLPAQVPKDSAGQVFAVEAFYLQPARQRALRRAFADILLKINCYFDLSICEPEEEKWQPNPPPEGLDAWITGNEKDACVLLPQENALFTLSRDDTCMAVYNPSHRLLTLLRPLAASAGLFLWQPPQGKGEKE